MEGPSNILHVTEKNQKTKLHVYVQYSRATDIEIQQRSSTLFSVFVLINITSYVFSCNTHLGGKIFFCKPDLSLAIVCTCVCPDIQRQCGLWTHLQSFVSHYVFECKCNLYYLTIVCAEFWWLNLSGKKDDSLNAFCVQAKISDPQFTPH